jgi:RNA polymerase sigma-70 factor (ECF subfamily)
MYFERYEKAGVSLRVARLEGRLVYAAYLAGAKEPAYFITMEFEDGRVTSIRDFRYVPYLVTEAEFELLDGEVPLGAA